MTITYYNIKITSEEIIKNSNKLIETLGTMQEYLSHFIIYVDDKIIAPEYLNSPILKKNSVVEVVPLILGAEIGLMTMIIVMKNAEQLKTRYIIVGMRNKFL